MSDHYEVLMHLQIDQKINPKMSAEICVTVSLHGRLTLI